MVVVVLAVAETVVDSEEADLHSAVDEAVLTEVTTVGPARCLKQLVQIVEKIVKFLLGQQTANLFIVAAVLKRWVDPEMKKDVRSEANLDLRRKYNPPHLITLNLKL